MQSLENVYPWVHQTPRCIHPVLCGPHESQHSYECVAIQNEKLTYSSVCVCVCVCACVCVCVSVCLLCESVGMCQGYRDSIAHNDNFHAMLSL